MAVSDVFNSLTFDGINSLDYGIYITGEAVYDAPERDVEAVEIPGRNGALILDKGRWKNLEVTYRAGTFGNDPSDFAEKVSAFRNAMATRIGYKRITDTYHPDEYRLGTLAGAFEVNAEGRKRAGEFDLVFNCQPQRFLTSGDTSQTITSGQTLNNPTLNEAKPLLEVEGYGAIDLNGQAITVENAVLGEVTLAEDLQIPVGAFHLPSAQINTGDTIYFSAGTYHVDMIARTGYSFPGYCQVTSGSGTIRVINSTRAAIDIPVPAWTATAGTSTTPTPVTLSFEIAVAWSDGSGDHSEIRSFTDVFSGVELWSSLTLNVTRTFGGGGVFDTTPAYQLSSVTADSTLSTLGHPTYIDCDLGEAYKVVDGSLVSLNKTVSLGSDLPVIEAGDNEITFDNTITELKITPRWWIL